MASPRTRLDDVIHSPVRFSIMAVLSKADRAEFAFVRDAIEVSDSVLSKQASALEAAGYIRIEKGHVGKRPRTWFVVTSKGDKAYRAHVAALRELVDGAV
ncbi:transcriptional regulator [Luteococcus sp. H138]|uniref:winged helix-turn-helix domain-containing protein n=1 Tax=unclassified Luteococcus TaxID=2639923 RepID=UPI00313CAA67